MGECGPVKDCFDVQRYNAALSKAKEAGFNVEGNWFNVDVTKTAVNECGHSCVPLDKVAPPPIARVMGGLDKPPTDEKAMRLQELVQDIYYCDRMDCACVTAATSKYGARALSAAKNLFTRFDIIAGRLLEGPVTQKVNDLIKYEQTLKEQMPPLNVGAAVDLELLARESLVSLLGEKEAIDLVSNTCSTGCEVTKRTYLQGSQEITVECRDIGIKVEKHL